MAISAAGLPPGKPRYVMGIGYPLDIVVCSALGADMYDSVYPTRTARFGVALVPTGVMKLKHQGYEQDFQPIDASCSCVCCKNYTRAFLHNLVAKNVPSAATLVSVHNIHYTQQLTRRMRQAIKDQVFPDWVRDYLRTMFPKGDVPQWVRDAMVVAGISLEGVATAEPAAQAPMDDIKEE